MSYQEIFLGQMKIDIKKISNCMLEEAIKLGWKLKERNIASSGSIYFTMYRCLEDKKEWIILRIADHRIVYLKKGWIRTYSHSPCELSDSDIIEVLSSVFGLVGDVF